MPNINYLRATAALLQDFEPLPNEVTGVAYDWIRKEPDTENELERAVSEALEAIDTAVSEPMSNDKIRDNLYNCIYVARQAGVERGICFGVRLAFDLLKEPS